MSKFKNKPIKTLNFFKELIEKLFFCTHTHTSLVNAFPGNHKKSLVVKEDRWRKLVCFNAFSITGLNQTTRCPKMNIIVKECRYLVVTRPKYTFKTNIFVQVWSFIYTLTKYDEVAFYSIKYQIIQVQKGIWYFSNWLDWKPQTVCGFSLVFKKSQIF